MAKAEAASVRFYDAQSILIILHMGGIMLFLVLIFCQGRKFLGLGFVRIGKLIILRVRLSL
jgi:hypothetical protein